MFFLKKITNNIVALRYVGIWKTCALFLTLLFCMLAIEVNYKQIRLSYYDSFYGERAMNAAIRIASTIDKQEFLDYATDKRTIDSNYLGIQQDFLFYQQLLQAEYVYAMAPQQGTFYKYIFDSSDIFVLTNDSDNLDDVSLWEPPSVLEVMRTGVPTHNEIYENVKYGALLAGHAPLLYNAEAVGTIGVDFAGDKLITQVEEDWGDIRGYFLWTSLLGILLGMATVGYYNHRYLVKLNYQYQFLRKEEKQEGK